MRGRERPAFDRNDYLEAVSARHREALEQLRHMIRAAAPEASVEAYQTGKGPLAFSAQAPLPAALVSKLVTGRMEEIEDAHTGRAAWPS